MVVVVGARDMVPSVVAVVVAIWPTIVRVLSLLVVEGEAHIHSPMPIPSVVDVQHLNKRL